jgi:predicted AlkP superfamily phosphohydrolase/phosphomutase
MRRGLAGLLLALLAAGCSRSSEKAASSSASPSTPAAARTAVEADDPVNRAKRPAGGRAPVIWLGLDGLDWELLDRLAAEGRMPNWKRLTGEGYSARLRSYVPTLSPVVWTSLATGVGPDVHRVLDFQEVDAKTGQRVPISGASRATPAIWNVASAAGLSVGVVGWWATQPAEEVKGFFVSDATSPILFEGLPPRGVAFPPSLSAGVEQIVSRDGAVSNEDLAKFVAMPPSEIAAELSSAQGLENKVLLLSRSIGATRVESRIARELYDRNLPDLMMLYLEGTDVVGHLFGSFVPPKMPCVSDAEFARYHGAVDQYYALVDRLLGQWMRRAAEDGATLIVNSDHGFRWGADRSCDRGSLDPATALSWHRLDGVFAAWGARVRPSPQRGHASVFDVEPTVAALLDLPVDRRAKGSVLREAFSGLTPPAREDLAATVPVHRLAAEPMSESQADEYAKKLKALGYLSGGEATRLEAAHGDRPGETEGAWNNLGMYLFNQGGAAGVEAAADAYRRALAISPDFRSAEFNLALLERSEGRDRPAVDGLFRSLAGAPPGGDAVVVQWARFYQERRRKEAEREVVERGAKLYPESEAVHRALGVLLFEGRDCGAADAALAPFEAKTRSVETLNALALVRACLGRRDEAAGLFRRSLALDPAQETVVRSLALLEGGPGAAASRKP